MYFVNQLFKDNSNIIKTLKNENLKAIFLLMKFYTSNGCN